MKLAETVTFGGSALDRAGHLRADPDEQQALMARPDARTIVIWRGKPLTSNENRDVLTRLAMDHPLAQASRVPPIFLGLDDGAPIFARDISGWAPEGLDRSQMGTFLDISEQVHPDGPEGAAFCELRRVMTWLSPRDAELAATAKSMFSWHRSHRFCAKCGDESKMALAGWQRLCPSCGAAHFPRTDPVVIMLITRGNSVLMGRSPGWPEGMYSLLAGFVEPGETLEAAVRREVFEEAGIVVGDVGYLASQPWPYPSSLMVGCRGAAQSDEITIDPTEIEDARWFTREEIGDAFAGRHGLLKPARKGAIAHFLLWNWLADRLD